MRYKVTAKNRRSNNPDFTSEIDGLAEAIRAAGAIMAGSEFFQAQIEGAGGVITAMMLAELLQVKNAQGS